MKDENKETKIEEKTEEKLVETKTEMPKEKSEKETSEKKEAHEEKKKTKVQKIKKEEAVVKGIGLPLSTKKSGAVCRFIKGKEISKAIKDLEEVIAMKKPVPMKGEYAHQKGKRIAGGGYPKKTAQYFIMLLKSLQANANQGNIDAPVITEAFANQASKPFGRFGTIKHKRSHIIIKAREKNKLKEREK
mgnify:CR=1 FL=1